MYLINGYIRYPVDGDIQLVRYVLYCKWIYKLIQVDLLILILY